MDKNAKKKLKDSFKQQQQIKFEESLPISISLLEEYFNFLDEFADECDCDDSFRLTKKFFQDKEVDYPKIINWLKDNGGYCDCEALANVEEKVEDLYE